MLSKNQITIIIKLIKSRLAKLYTISLIKKTSQTFSMYGPTKKIIFLISRSMDNISTF